MAKRISIQDANREALKRNADMKSIQRPAAPVAPQPTEQRMLVEATNKAIEGVSCALGEVQKVVMGLEAGRADTAAELGRIVESITSKDAGPGKWTFRITERDTRGNIVEFEAVRGNR